jgi:site-specific DNA-methyltransferase (adenine-specific)
MRRFFEHSCEDMHELQDSSVALTVTSPPYWNAIDYETHASDKSQHYRTRSYSNGYSDYEAYLNWVAKIFAEVLRVTKPGGFCSIVVGTVLLKGKHLPVPFHFVTRLLDVGWDFHQDIIWHKCTAGVKRAGVTIQKPLPGYYYPNIMTEYILVFRKPGDPIYSGRTTEEKVAASIPIGRVFTMDVANNIWHIAPVPPDFIDHPCPFPEEIPYRLISAYSYPGDLVLDPFLGSGQTTKVAHQMGRDYVGYEIVHKYVDLARIRLSEPMSLRPEQLIAVFEKTPIDAPLSSSDGRPPKKRSRRSKRPIPASELPLFQKLSIKKP